MFKFIHYHFSIFVILNLILVSYPSRAAIEDDFVELTEKALLLNNRGALC